jgi:hypothetical protein
MKYNHEIMLGKSIPDDCLSPEELRVRFATQRKINEFAKQKEKTLASKNTPLGSARAKMPPIDYKALNSLHN